MEYTNKDLELVVVAPRKDIFGIDDGDSFQGVISPSHKSFNSIMEQYAKTWGLLRRFDADSNKDYKQMIPYVVIKNNNDVFVMKRLESQIEKRLHGKLGVGVGGHMNYTKAKSFKDMILENCMRELNEEVYIPKEYINMLDVIGLINDDSTDVGKHHIGVLYVLNVPSKENIKVKEEDKMEGMWEDKKTLLDNYKDCLESWSKISLDLLCNE